MAWPAPFPGWLLERNGDAAPRGMTVTPRGEQNPAYRPTPLFMRSSVIAMINKSWCAAALRHLPVQKRPSLAALLAASPSLRWTSPQKQLRRVRRSLRAGDRRVAPSCPHRSRERSLFRQLRRRFDGEARRRAKAKRASERVCVGISLSFKYLWATAQKCLEKWSHSRLSL